MLVKYTFENFGSYKDECVVDFSVTNKTPDSYFDYQTDFGIKVSKVMSVLGPNGAGKSNLLKPIAFISWFASESFGDFRKDKRIPVDAHALRRDENTKIEIDFIAPRWADVITEEGDDEDFDVPFKYILELNSDRVFEETLKVKTSRLYSRVFERKFEENTNSYSVKVHKELGPNIPVSILNKAPKNCSLLSYIESLKEDETSPVCEESNLTMIRLAYHYFNNCVSNIVKFGRSHINERMRESIQFFNDFPKEFEFAKTLLRNYDMGIDDIVLEKVVVVNPEDGSQNEQLIPYCIHNKDTEPFKLPMFWESSGTQSAFCALAIISQILLVGGWAILDEFDNDFHPDLTTAIVNLFKNDTTNPKQAQLIFNTHTVEVLKNLRKQHVYLVEKENGASEAYKASDIEGLKDRDSLYKKYISGALGAIPEIC